jgi:hypothetical protein
VQEQLTIDFVCASLVFSYDEINQSGESTLIKRRVPSNLYITIRSFKGNNAIIVINLQLGVAATTPTTATAVVLIDHS